MSLANARLAALALVCALGTAAHAGPKPKAVPEPAKPAAPAKAAPAGGGKSDGGLPSFGAFSLTSKNEPIQITSEKLDFDYKNRRTVFRGGVDVIQGELHLQTDQLTVDYDQVGEKQELKAVNATGHVTISQGPKKASGDRAIFDQSNRTMVLTGNAVLEEGSNQVAGDRIVVHPDESRMEVLGENRRVKVVLFPGQGALANVDGKDGSKPSEGAAPVVTPETPAGRAAKP